MNLERERGRRRRAGRDAGDDARLERLHASDLDADQRARHDTHMAHALALAGRNPARPFGAVLVARTTGAVLAEGVNVADVNPLMHGETAAIDACAHDHPDAQWSQLTLYTTAEPCPMCAAAIAWAGVGEVVVGSSIATLSSLGFRQIEIPCKTMLRAATFYRGRLIEGVLRERTDEMYAALAERQRNGGS
jgi:tRNA(Arg) A34 adenosine deaminase TadA